MQLNGKAAATALRGALREDAKSWEENLEYEGGFSYAALATALRETYGGASQRYYYQLKKLRHAPAQTLAEFNK